MTEFRVVGTVGETGVMTHWMDCPRGEAVGVQAGLEIRGWEDTDIEERDE